MSDTLRKLLLVFPALVIVGFATEVSAQTITQPDGSTSTGIVTGNGQNFRATATTTVSRIAVRSRSAVTTTLSIYQGGLGSAFGPPLQSQTVNLTDSGSNASGYDVITLNIPLSVEAGRQYSFVLTSSDLSYSTANPYAFGTRINNSNTTVPADDLAFQVFENVASPVPTLSEWAMILFGTILAGGAALDVQRRRQFV